MDFSGMKCFYHILSCWGIWVPEELTAWARTGISVLNVMIWLDFFLHSFLLCPPLLPHSLPLCPPLLPPLSSPLPSPLYFSFSPSAIYQGTLLDLGTSSTSLFSFLSPTSSSLKAHEHRKGSFFLTSASVVCLLLWGWGGVSTHCRITL